MRDLREDARLDASRLLKLLDTPSSESFDRITRMASQIFNLPIAAVSLTDSDRQWLKSRVGIADASMPRDGAPCAEVAETNEAVVIEDLLTDPTYFDSGLAQAGRRFYAGAPLVTRDGYGLGALCVVGNLPRTATPAEMAALNDLAAMVMAQIELQHAFGRVDPVSELPNRHQFRDDLTDLARDHAGEERFAVVVDLARYDEINKITRVLGGERVDQLVREAALSLSTQLGPDRTAYHVGATQFAFLSQPRLERAAYMELLQATFATLRAQSSVRFVTRVAIGVRPFRLGAVSPEDVLRGAASAAQDARTTDGSIALYSPRKDLAHRRQYNLLGDFGAALETGDQLRLVFQPRVDLATGRCVGVEALLRWQHPRLGEISPAEFIPIIEQTSLARPMTQWVLDAALDQLADWGTVAPDVVVSFNISATNLSEVDLIQRIQLALLKRAVRPDRLEIELTESAIMDQPEAALAMLHELAATGICLAIDDFGTGQSSLAYLQRVPAHVVKIDQSFVRGLVATDGSDFALLETMVGMAHRLGFRVVTEGVETPEAADILSGIGCEEAQGYLYSRPIEADQIPDWIATRHEARRIAAA